ncbi:MAG: hypothetical protein IJC56_10860 [Clostridia bacterium]|nr:hypothetical protein [Clostridia bacterium]
MNDRLVLDLNGSWEMRYAPEKGGRNEDYSPGMENFWPCIPVKVPGNSELALVEAGVEQDPFYDTHQLDFAKYEYYQFIYQTTFAAPGLEAGERAVLRFDGIDTIADVYLNDVHVYRAENMFVEHEMDITELVQPENTLKVHFHSAMNFARSQYYTIGMRGTVHRNEICCIRKAGHTFGWDIAPRLVTTGLWRPASIVARKATRFTQVYFATSELDMARRTATLEYAYRFDTDADTLDGFSVRVTGSCGEHTFSDEQPAWFVSANHQYTVHDPVLWWPRGYGEAALYDVKMELIHFGEVVDVYETRIGIRTVRLERSFEIGNQKFQIYVNETPIMVRGTNWVPLDAMHGRDMERLDRAVQLVRDCGCNMMRSWGGGVYESGRFFELCDEYGIMVWQDFCMGNTNYPQDENFAKVIEEEARKVICRLRNHASLAIWSGDNEVDHKNMGFNYPHYDARYNRVAHETLVRCLQAHDPYRFFVRSSPEIPDGFGLYDVPEQHNWGPRAYFKDDYYKHATASFIGEAGYHGCPAPSSIRRFITPENVWPWDNKAWAVHSTEDVRIEEELNGRNKLMADQVKLLCADEPEDIDEFAVISQISQAEALKFFIERTRCLKWKRTGIIWWNMLDCWPQISDAVVDYYFTKKLAWHYCHRSQQPRIAMIAEINGWNHDVMLANDTLENAEFTWSIEDGDTGEVLASGMTKVAAGENANAATFGVDPSAQRLLILKWEANGEKYANHFITGFPKYKKADLFRWLEIIRKLPDGFEVEL